LVKHFGAVGYTSAPYKTARRLDVVDAQIKSIHGYFHGYYRCESIHGYSKWISREGKVSMDIFKIPIDKAKVSMDTFDE